jgi:ubiquinone/menaquinone biosynthesis C-methylase UbiE
MGSTQMQLDDPSAYRVLQEERLLASHLDLRGLQVLELGCGTAGMTRWVATRLGAARIVATEVDPIQHQKNLAITDLANVEFRYGGAEAIDAAAGSFDAVLMFKSLHHVPSLHLETALEEIHRVLRPDGRLYISEPIYRGDFNAILSLFNDEQEVRQLAFQALVGAVERGLFALEQELFFDVPGSYRSWEEFAARFLEVTHTQLQISPELYQRIHAAFMAHMTPDGAHFLRPHRADILRCSK